MKKLSVLGALFLAACVTINIYFPAAAAEKAADEIIKDIQNVPHTEEPVSSLPEKHAALYRWFDQAIGLLISSAEAAEADLSIDSTTIRRLRASMESRFPSLKPLYDSGVIGIQEDGLLAVKDPGSVPLKDKNKVNKLVAAENQDRNSLYQAIADANGHPEWFAQIKSTFASRWVSNAQRGWWYRKSGSWKQK
ncbi:MAG: YdbL family protein [Gammaproteobacteria bacterium]